MGRRPLLIALLTLCVPALAGCGGAGGSSSIPAGSAPRSDQLPATALVLRGSDIGAGYLVEPSVTHRVTLATELQHESARARAADHKGFIDGYQAEYVRQGVAGVLSEALTYRTEAAARVVSSDRTGAAYVRSSLHGHITRPPRTAPGRSRIMIEGTLRGLPVFVYGWQHGRVLEVVTVFGHGVSRDQLVRLALKQDRRLTHPSFGDA